MPRQPILTTTRAPSIGDVIRESYSPLALFSAPSPKPEAMPPKLLPLTIDDFEQRRDQRFWRGLVDSIPNWDCLIEDFNAEVGAARAR